MRRLLFRGSTGRWVCQRCGAPLLQGPAPIMCPSCDSTGPTRLRVTSTDEPCPFGAIVCRLSTSGLERLELCRRAQCGHLAAIGGAMLCQYRGKNCEWLNLWAAWLNSGRACELWRE